MLLLLKGRKASTPRLDDFSWINTNAERY